MKTNMKDPIANWLLFWVLTSAVTVLVHSALDYGMEIEHSKDTEDILHALSMIGTMVYTGIWTLIELTKKS